MQMLRDRLAMTLVIAAGALPGGFMSAQAADAETCDCRPATGQPAADALASHDLWGNPTFVGGVTNGGPDSGSVW